MTGASAIVLFDITHPRGNAYSLSWPNRLIITNIMLWDLGC